MLQVKPAFQDGLLHGHGYGTVGLERVSGREDKWFELVRSCSDRLALPHSWEHLETLPGTCWLASSWCFKGKGPPQAQISKELAHLLKQLYLNLQPENK